MKTLLGIIVFIAGIILLSIGAYFIYLNRKESKLVIKEHWEYKDGVCRYVPERTLYSSNNHFIIHGNGWVWSRFVECNGDTTNLLIEPHNVVIKDVCRERYPYNDNSEAVTFEDLKKCSPKYENDK